MSTIRSLFPGAMSPDGFLSCFDHLIDETKLRRKLILKGGPGVGKSTFMRRIHAALCADGEPSTLYVCSGDPDSLDAVAIPGKGLLILDGTAPHTVDPVYPGARDSIINLGEYLDEPALRPRLGRIRDVMNEHRLCMQRARAHLKAACVLREEGAALLAACVREEQLRRMTRALILSALDETQAVQEADAAPRVITEAVTPKGEVSLIAEHPRARVIRLTGHACMDFTPVLRALRLAAQERGVPAQEHPDARCPGALLHLTLPTLDTLVTTSALLPSQQIFDFSACLSQGALLRRECALEQSIAAVRQGICRAVSAMEDAKALHDELESFYVPNMDFARWQTRLSDTLASLS